MSNVLNPDIVTAGYACTGHFPTKMILPKRFGRVTIDLRTVTVGVLDGLRTKYPAAEGFDGIAVYLSYTAPG